MKPSTDSDIQEFQFKYEKGKIVKLGSGSGGVVYLGFLSADPTTEVAVKVSDPDHICNHNCKKLGQLKEELATQKEGVHFTGDDSFICPKKVRGDKELRLHETISGHPNIVSMLGKKYARLETWLFMERMPFTLHRYRRERDEIPRKEIWGFMKDLAAGLDYLHQLKIVHTDIKPTNLFIASDGTLKIGDFDQVMKVSKNKFAKTTLCTAEYRPIEAFEFSLVFFQEFKKRIATSDEGEKEKWMDHTGSSQGLPMQGLEIFPSFDIWSVSFILLDLISIEPFYFREVEICKGKFDTIVLAVENMITRIKNFVVGVHKSNKAVRGQIKRSLGKDGFRFLEMTLVCEPHKRATAFQLWEFSPTPPTVSLKKRKHE